MAFKMWQRGNDVIAEQQRLNKAGAKLVVDGIYGPQTQAAQKKYGVNQTKTTTTTKTKTPTYGTMPTTLPNTGTF
ncbi:MAG TPA: peptidoglycan-binding protein, partial [Flavobacterium sp.]|nr:peptidoglycan-binding protein [Flavobacterium sp.]